MFCASSNLKRMSVKLQLQQGDLPWAKDTRKSVLGLIPCPLATSSAHEVFTLILDQLFIPKLSFGSRDFRFSAPRTSNSLSLRIRECQFLLLKTITPSGKGRPLPIPRPPSATGVVFIVFISPSPLHVRIPASYYASSPHFDCLALGIVGWPCGLADPRYCLCGWFPSTVTFNRCDRRGSVVIVVALSRFVQ